MHDPDLPAAYLVLVSQAIHLLQTAMLFGLIRLHLSLNVPRGLLLLPFLCAVTAHNAMAFLLGLQADAVAPAGDLISLIGGSVPLAGLALAWYTVLFRRPGGQARRGTGVHVLQWDQVIQERMGL